MKILTKKEVFASLCIGATLGIFVALFLITYLIPPSSSGQISLLKSVLLLPPKIYLLTATLLLRISPVMFRQITLSWMIEVLLLHGWMNNHTMKVDVYVKRKPGESDATYFRRTNDLGIIYTTALYKSPK